MLLGFTVTNPIGESLYLSLKEPEKSGLIVRNIDGVGSPTATINLTEYATIDGSRFNMARASNRVITIQLDYMDSPTIEHSRRMAYRYFPAKGKVDLRFHTDLPAEYTTTGYVESNNPTIFSQNSGCTISIKCPDPYFHSVESQISNFYATEPNLEFPYSNESLTEDLTEFGIIHQNLIKDIFYDGSQPVGFTMMISISRATGDITITNATTYDHMIISSDRIYNLTGTEITAGDVIILNTIKGEKSLILAREDGQAIYNILGALDEYTSWLVLNPGYNTITVETEDNSQFVNVVIQNDLLYEGI